MIDEQKKVSKVSLKESIMGIVRGYKFVHDRQLEIPDRHADDCRRPKKEKGQENLALNYQSRRIRIISSV